MKELLTYLIVFSSVICNAQPVNNKGYSSFQKQDKSFITTDLRAKHSVSLGFYNSINSPFNDNLTPLFGIHLGYNYLILSKKDKYKKKKNIVKSRTVINSYIGLHFNFSTNNEYLINLIIYHPLIRSKGILTTWLFFNEIGIGVHQRPDYLNPANLINPNLSLELLRIKFYKAPLFITASSNYDLNNDFSIPEPKNIEFMLGLKYFFFKNKIN